VRQWLRLLVTGEDAKRAGLVGSDEDVLTPPAAVSETISVRPGQLCSSSSVNCRLVTFKLLEWCCRDFNALSSLKLNMFVVLLSSRKTAVHLFECLGLPTSGWPWESNGLQLPSNSQKKLEICHCLCYLRQTLPLCLWTLLSDNRLEYDIFLTYHPGRKMKHKFLHKLRGS